MKYSKIKQLFKNKRAVRAGAGVLTAVVIVSGIGGYHVYAQKNSETQKREVRQERQRAKEENETLMEQVLKTQAGRDEGSAEKEETVYVVSDANGAPSEVIVSDWLKNKDGASVISDVTDLTDVENVKGEESYTAGKDGKLLWQADGKDIYYQGKTSKELPVDVKVTYYLDGKEIGPDELAGRSGKVKIRMDYTNHAKDKEKDVCVPFTVISGMILDDGFSNIKVTNGKVLNDGSKSMVVGFAFPGLSDSLNIEENNLDDKLKIPEYVEVSADVTDFSLDMTMSVMMPDILQELDVDKEVDLSAVEDALDALSDASDQLVDGGAQLKDGAGELSGGVKAYTDGAAALRKGIDAYTGGVSQMKSGVKAYTDGVSKVASGTQELAGKSGTLKSGIRELVQGAMQVQTYFEGDSGLVSGAKAISSGVNKLDEALRAGLTEADKKQAAKSVDAMFAKDKETYQEIKNQASGQYEAALKNSSALQGGVESGVSQAMYGAYYNAFVQLNQKAYAQAQKSETELKQAADSFAKQMLQASSGAVSDASKQLVSGIADGSSDLVGTSVVDACREAALTGVESGISSTKSAIASQIEANGSNSLVEGSKTLSAGISKLYKEGIVPLSDGMNTLNDSVPELMKGIRALNSGASALDEKSSDLKKGVDTLDTKGTELGKGAAALDGKSAELQKGAADLKDGAEKLSEGIVQFDKDGIQKLSDAYHGDVEQLLERIEKVKDAGKKYHTFSAISDDMSGSVKFIIRTGEIGK